MSARPVPAPSPLVFLTKRQRAARRMVGLNPDVVHTTGWWRSFSDLDALDEVEFVRDAHAGECAVCRGDDVIVVGQDRP